VNSAGDNEERANECDETDVIARRVQYSLRMMQPEEVVAGSDRRQNERDAMIIFFLIVFENGRQQGDAEQHRQERHQAERSRLDRFVHSK